MGVTAFVRMINFSDSYVYFNNVENGRNYWLRPRSGKYVYYTAMNEWVPWCDSQRDFDNGHRILLTIQNQSNAIWQSREADGDFLRYSANGHYRKGAPRIPGDSGVDGNREIQILENYSFKAVSVLFHITVEPSILLSPHEMLKELR